MDSPADPVAPKAAASLDAAAAGNMALCKELISGTDGPQRSACVIAEDLCRSTHALPNWLHGIIARQATSGEVAINRQQGWLDKQTPRRP